MKEDPLPLAQEDPELIEYCQVAFDSRPETLIFPLVVIPSELEDPVSLASASEGADGGIVSILSSGKLLLFFSPKEPSSEFPLLESQEFKKIITNI